MFTGFKPSAGFTGIAIVLAATSQVSAQQRSDNELSETLSWMDNSYNPHPGVSGAYGHGKTGWYSKREQPYDEVLVSGSRETFTYDGCQMTIHVEGDRAAKVSPDFSLSYRFNLGDINPQSIRMRTISHIGGFYCEAFPGENMDCDHAEIAFKTRLEAPLIDTGSSKKNNDAFFNVDDVEYGKRFVRAFRHAVELCGGKPEPF
jgi:hypothetical protein